MVKGNAPVHCNTVPAGFDAVLLKDLRHPGEDLAIGERVLDVRVLSITRIGSTAGCLPLRGAACALTVLVGERIRGSTRGIHRSRPGRAPRTAGRQAA
jgi:hypothetical protein